MLNDIYMTIFDRLDMFYEIYISYNIPYSSRLSSIRQMTWPAFLKFGHDLGYDEQDDYLAYYFFISSTVSKQLDPKVSGNTLEENYKWCLKRIETNNQHDLPSKINFSNFIEIIVRLADDALKYNQKITDKIIGYVDKILPMTARSICFTYKIFCHEQQFDQLKKQYSPMLIQIYQRELENKSENLEQEQKKIVLTFSMVTKLLKKWKFVQDTVYADDASRISLIKDKTLLTNPDSFAYDKQLEYTNIVELF